MGELHDRMEGDLLLRGVAAVTRKEYLRCARALAAHYRRPLFDLLFATTADTLLAFGRDPQRLGAEIGFTLVLHTWTRELRFHHHVHAIVTGGGLDIATDRWVSARQDYLFPVEALSHLFRDKFLHALIDLFEADAFKDSGLDPKSFRILTRRLALQQWVVYAKKPFGGPEPIVTYLGLYTHRVALSNARLLSVSDALVTFAPAAREAARSRPTNSFAASSSRTPRAVRQDSPLRAPRPSLRQHPSASG